MTTTTSELPAARFPRLERQGWMWGLSGGQVIFLAIAIATILPSTFAGLPAMLTMLTLVSGPLATFALISWGRRPLTSRTWERAVWIFRTVTAQRRHLARPEKPVPEGTLSLPGPAGARISVQRTVFGDGALIHDARTQTVTAVLRCESASFALASDAQRGERAVAFADLCKQTVTRPGISRVMTLARTIPAAQHAARDYYDATLTARQGGVPLSTWAAQQYTDLLAGENMFDAQSLGHVVHRDVLVAVTISTRAIPTLIKSAGGGLAGASVVLAREVDTLAKALEGTGVRVSRWLSATDLAEVVRIAFDPAAVDQIEVRRAAGQPPLDLAGAGPLVVLEEPEHLVTDSAVHRTFWVQQWPSEARVGFLEGLLVRGDYPHTFTQIFTPVAQDKAIRDVGKSVQALDSQRGANEKLGRRVTYEMEQAKEDVLEREAEITEGYTDLLFTGYLTVSGADVDELEANCAAAVQAAPGMDLRVLRRQQAAAFTAAALPLGWGLK